MNLWPWSRRNGKGHPVERRRTDRKPTLAEHHHSLVEDIQREAGELRRTVRQRGSGG